MKIAIIGSGISGLSTALLLSQKHQITIFEIDKRYGGHANTVEIKNEDSTINVDTGFIVFNKLNYPNLVGFLKHLKWMPETCAYKILDQGGQLPKWHPLVCGNNEEIVKSGNSVKNRVTNELKVKTKNLPNHIYNW